jgi:hypothetical protein
VKVGWPSVELSSGPIHSVYKLELGPDSPSASGPSPHVKLGWPSVEPSIGPSAFLLRSVRRGGDGARIFAVASV